MEADIDVRAVMTAIEGLKDNEFRGAVRTAIRKSLAIVRSSVQVWVRRKYPGGRRKNSGMLRGKKYGPLYKDVRLSVWKKQAKGGSVSLLEGRKANRVCVLRWLEESKDERVTEKGKSRGSLREMDEFFQPAVATSIGKATQELNRLILEEVQKKWAKHK